MKTVKQNKSNKTSNKNNSFFTYSNNSKPFFLKKGTNTENPFFQSNQNIIQKKGGDYGEPETIQKELERREALKNKSILTNAEINLIARQRMWTTDWGDYGKWKTYGCSDCANGSGRANSKKNKYNEELQSKDIPVKLQLKSREELLREIQEEFKNKKPPEDTKEEKEEITEIEEDIEKIEEVDEEDPKPDPKLDIKFKGGTSEYLDKEDAFDQLQPLIDYLNANPDKTIFLAGHTGSDNSSFKEGNSKEILGQTFMVDGKKETLGDLQIARAKRVAKSIISKGIQYKRIKYGAGSHRKSDKNRFVAVRID